MEMIYIFVVIHNGFLMVLIFDMSAFFNFVNHIETHNVRDKSVNEDAYSKASRYTASTYMDLLKF